MKELVKLTSNLAIEYINSTGHREYVEKDLSDDGIDTLILAFKDALMGFGFSPELVKECIPQE